jgi:hypothetical protein
MFKDVHLQVRALIPHYALMPNYAVRGRHLTFLDGSKGGWSLLILIWTLSKEQW